MSKQRCVIIDYGMGNLHSAHGALASVADTNTDVQISSDAQIIAAADRLVLPGVGAMGDCMSEMRRAKIDAQVTTAIMQKPVLGICVGMQALLERSEESNGVDGMSVFNGEVKHFKHGLGMHKDLKIPHMGWNQVKQIEHPLWHGIEDMSRFYFVHSYYASTDNRSQIKGVCEYGIEFVAALGQKNLFATQFHPEKSHCAGLQLLRNFLTWDGAE